MNKSEKDKTIGGYFKWEFPMEKRIFPHSKGLLLNSGHAAIQLLFKHIKNVSKVYIPLYTCDIVKNSLSEIGISTESYHINYDMELEKGIVLKETEYLIYVNYFGIMDSYISVLAGHYKEHLIIDNAQAFFAEEIENCHQIYSPRKFVGVPDGGILVTPLSIDISEMSVSTSNNHCSHLLKRTEDLVSDGYVIFKDEEEYLRNSPIGKMSKVTISILESLDYESIKKTRIENYKYLHSKLKDRNIFKNLLNTRGIESFRCPMVYPFYTESFELRNRLIKNSIFVAQYWPNIKESCTNDTEYALYNHIIPLPIDQRYGEKEMEYIIKTIIDYGK